ncbi:MAG: response regulator [Deltaproteobacteria bacterium]|nr:response regulator [Deltaproteobacteria bacterium]
MGDGAEKPLRVLLVDDEEMVLKSLVRLFINEPFLVETCNSGELALELIQQQNFAVVVSDQRMPGLSGTDFLAECARIQPDAVRLLLTGHADFEAALAAVNRSKVFRFLHKPWNDQQLLTEINQALEHYRINLENRRLNRIVCRRNQELLEINQHLEERVAQRTKDVRKLLNTLKLSLSQLGKVFFSMMELYEPEIAGHGRRTARIAVMIAEVLGLAGKEKELVEQAALYHDIGLIGIPRAILDTEEESLERSQVCLIKQHPEMAYRILSQVDSLKAVAELVRAHHENFAGGGYPFGLKGSDIPLGARIIRVANDFDVMLNKKGWAKKDVLQELKRKSPAAYDPAVVNVILIGDEIKKMEWSGEIPITFEKLRPGMVLGSDMRTASGRFLMAKGSMIEAEHLTSLQNFHKFDPIVGYLYICRGGICSPPEAPVQPNAG